MKIRAMIMLPALMLAAAATATAQEQTGLNPGDPVPAFEAMSDSGEIWRSSDHVGEKLLVVYFYPAAMTGGCTKQACAFRDNRSRLQELGAEVVGVSGDRPENLRVFKGAHRINFPLLSDTSGAVARAFGVPLTEGGTIKRTVDGKEIEMTREVTTARWTFIIGRDGRVLYRDTEVDAEGDGANVVAAIERLRAE